MASKDELRQHLKANVNEFYALYKDTFLKSFEADGCDTSFTVDIAILPLFSLTMARIVKEVLSKYGFSDEEIEYAVEDFIAEFISPLKED